MTKIKTVLYALSLLIIFNQTLISSNVLDRSEINQTPIIVPVGGNGWVVGGPFENPELINDEGIFYWNNNSQKVRVYFNLPKSGELKVGLNAKVPSGSSIIRCSLNGFGKEITLSNSEFQNSYIGIFDIREPGYNFIELEGIKKSGSLFAVISDVLLGGNATEGDIRFVEKDFYWARRGPSVHLKYELPEHTKDVLYFYSEINVPEGQDVIGSYFMAGGFKNGYFGFQVNSENERKILFSVWSPFDTQNPEEIPEDYRIDLVKKGDDVYTGKFGNEGSGAQSYLTYNWKAGNTYKFLLKGEPSGNNKTIYTAYFYAPEVGKWKLIASFKRPFTNSYLTQLHSFLENYIPETGSVTRRALYQNQWVYDTNNTWHEITKAQFSGDVHARNRIRLDFWGGAEHEAFILKNCGFFNADVKLDSYFIRKPGKQNPNIDFSKLP